WGWTGYGRLGLYLPGKIRIAADANYVYQPKTASFNQDFEQFLLNASIEKKFMKSENVTLSLSGRDLLNQNTGFRRSAFGNVISQTSFNTIRRYFMLSLIWDFNKMGGMKTVTPKGH
ncbi:TonB-dependent receptor, partial [Pseudoxanthomonas sp. SGD-10]